MIKKLLLFCAVLIIPMIASAAFIRNHPTQIEQADGTIIQCFSSGDEFVNYLHDADGYTIIQASDGFYYYAIRNNEQELIPSKWKVGVSKPQSLGIQAHLLPSAKWYEQRVASFQTSNFAASPKLTATGTINGIVIFIKFADDNEFETTDLNKLMYNFASDAGPSLKHFYHTASYKKLTIENYFCPRSDTSTRLSYTDSHKRNYFKAYNATLNPDGYKNDTERGDREWQLLKTAVEWLAENSMIPEDVNFDSDGDGYADFVSFIIRGKSIGWSDLLWAHKWQFSQSMEPFITPQIRVGTYAFQPEDQSAVTIICHEAFHAFGAPDLYHYDEAYRTLNPCGKWDLMDGGDGQMLAFMKHSYTTWKTALPITQSGHYVLFPQAETDTQSMYIYKANTDESIIFEFRKRSSDAYENTLPGSGLIISRSNAKFKGNTNYNGLSSHDGIYVFRPGGTPNSNGNPNMANFSSTIGRVYFGPDSSNYAFTSKGEQIPIEVRNIIDHGDSLSFDLVLLDDIQPMDVKTFNAKRKDRSIALAWEMEKSQKYVIIAVNTEKEPGTLVDKKNYAIGNKLPCGSQIIYIGSAESFNYNMTPQENTLYFKIFSSVRSFYSSGFAEINYSDMRYSLLDNRLPTDENRIANTWRAPNWGSVVGHNSKGHTRFLERYDLGQNEEIIMSGIALHTDNVYAAKGSDSKFTIQLYRVDKDNLPSTLFYSEVFSMDTMQTGIHHLNFIENLSITDSFFVGVEISYAAPMDTLSIMSTKSELTRPNRFVIYDGNKLGYLSDLAALNISAGILPIIVHQPYIRLSADSLMLRPEDKQNVYVYSNDGADFTLTSDKDWLHFDVEKALDRIRLKVDASTDNIESEEATLKVRISEKLETTCKVFRLKGTSILVEETNIPQMKIYPNPAKNHLTVEPIGNTGLLKLYSSDGRLLSQFPINGKQIHIAIDKLAKGHYIIKEESRQSQRSASIIKL